MRLVDIEIVGLSGHTLLFYIPARNMLEVSSGSQMRSSNRSK